MAVKKNVKVGISQDNFFPKNRKSKSGISQDNFFPKNRKGLSAVVTSMILILIVLSSAGIIWVIINGTVENQLGQAESCRDITQKVTLNSRYTCYNPSSGEVHFSLSVGEIELDRIIVSIGNELDSKSYTLDNTSKTISGLRGFDGSAQVKMPGKNAGETYIATGFSEFPNKIEVAPSINGNLCGVSDSLSGIPEC